MPDLGKRENVMGPQPIAKRVVPPAEVEATAKRITELLSAGKVSELTELTVESMRTEMEALAKSAPAGRYSGCAIVAMARVNLHYYLKIRMMSADGEPFLFQVRIGETKGRWMVFDIMNLSGLRSAWTR
jgi:hypothetical protein